MYYEHDKYIQVIYVVVIRRCHQTLTYNSPNIDLQYHDNISLIVILDIDV